MTSAGTVVVSIPANVTTEGNFASTSTDDALAFDNNDLTPPASAVVAERSIVNGVASITPSTLYAPGTTQATLTAITSVEGQTRTFSFDVTARAGNTRHCTEKGQEGARSGGSASNPASRWKSPAPSKPL